MADDIGYEAFGSYGNTNYETPQLDKMASEGMQFNHCYAQPLCTPSRVKIMTGKYNFRNYERWGFLNSNETTFAHLLKAEGYATCIAGKWQLRGDEYAPYKAGFDEYHLWQLTFTSYNERYKNPRVLENGKMIKYNNGEYGPQLHTNFILDFIDRHKDKPFLAYYPMALHIGRMCLRLIRMTTMRWKYRVQEMRIVPYLTPSILKMKWPMSIKLLDKLLIKSMSWEFRIIH